MRLTAVLLLPVAVLQVAAIGLTSNCPSMKDYFAPCKCLQPDIGLYITCTGISDVDVLKEVAGRLHIYNVTKLKLLSSHLMQVPEDLFFGDYIQNLEFVNSSLVYDRFPMFTGLEGSLETFTAVRSFTFVKLSRLPLNYLQALQAVYLKENYIPELDNEWLWIRKRKVDSLSENIDTLVLIDNGIKKLGTRAFVSLPRLKELVLVGNSFDGFPRSVLPNPAYYLRNLDLSRNNISQLSQNFFSGMPALKEVYLNGNQIQTIAEEVWSHVWDRLYIISLTDNPIVCNQTLQWIYRRKLPAKFTGHCAAPEHLEGKKLWELTALELE